MKLRLLPRAKLGARALVCSLLTAEYSDSNCAVWQLAAELHRRICRPELLAASAPAVR